MFPFTFDRWTTDGGVLIVLRENGPARQIGTEALETPSVLEIADHGSRRSWAGLLSCGS